MPFQKYDKKKDVAAQANERCVCGESSEPLEENLLHDQPVAPAKRTATSMREAEHAEQR